MLNSIVLLKETARPPVNQTTLDKWAKAEQDSWESCPGCVNTVFWGTHFHNTIWSRVKQLSVSSPTLHTHVNNKGFLNSKCQIHTKFLEQSHSLFFFYSRLQFWSDLLLGVSAAQQLPGNQIKLPCVDHSKLLDSFFWHTCICIICHPSHPWNSSFNPKKRKSHLLGNSKHTHTPKWHA